MDRGLDFKQVLDNILDFVCFCARPTLDDAFSKSYTGRQPTINRA